MNKLNPLGRNDITLEKFKVIYKSFEVFKEPIGPQSKYTRPYAFFAKPSSLVGRVLIGLY